MRRHIFLGALLAAALGTAGCEDQKLEPTAPSSGDPAFAQQSTKPKVDRDNLRLPASAQKIETQYSDLTRRVIDSTQFVCPPSTPLIDYLNETIDHSIAVEPDIFFTLVNLAADQVPSVDGILFTTEATPQFFGYTGEYDHTMTKVERDVKRFWDIDSDDIQLVAMHGTMLLDVDRVARVYEAAFTVGGSPISHDLAVFFAQTVHDALAASTTMDGGNYPLWTFNAFAVPGDGAARPNKIVVGDGVLESYKVIGFDDVAPQAVYAHEFGHHIQFQRGYFNDPLATNGSPAEQTRYTELMADAFSAYYLTHSRGAALNQKRVAEFLQVFFNIGDCAFDNPGHHGTPNQRMRSAEFGFEVADQAQKQGHILTADEFHALFVAAYPTITAPDATT